MDSGYTTEIATGQTVEVPEGVTDTAFEIDGKVLLAGTLADSEVGNSSDYDVVPPYGGAAPLPVSGTLIVEDGGSASGVTLQNDALVDVAAGGTLTTFSAFPQFSGYPSTYDGVQVNVLGGGTASGGTLEGGYLTVAGQATDLMTYGEQVTISGTVSGLTAASNAYYDHGGFTNVTTVENGGSLRDSTLSGPGELLTQLGATASDITLTGSVDSGLVPFSPGLAGGDALIEQAASTVTGLTAAGGSFAYLQGYTGDLTVTDQAAVFVRGGLAGAKIISGDRDVYQFLGVPAEDPIPTNPSYITLQYEPFEGLAISSGGHALGVIDDGLMAVESGGQATDVDVQATLGVFTGGTATDATLEAGSQTLLGGQLVYDGAGTTIDKGAILSATLSGYQANGSSPITESFTNGRIVQDGVGTLVLDAFNSFGAGVVIEKGTVELAAANAAGAGGGVHFVEPASGLPTLEILKLDPAFAGAVAGATTEYFPTVSGLGLGTVVDLTGQAFQSGDTVSVIDNGTALALNGPRGALHDTISIASSAATGLRFLAISDGAHGTDLVAFPTELFEAGSHSFCTAPLQQLIDEVMASLPAAGSTALSASDSKSLTIPGLRSEIGNVGAVTDALARSVVAPTAHTIAHQLGT